MKSLLNFDYQLKLKAKLNIIIYPAINLTAANLVEATSMQRTASSLSAMTFIHRCLSEQDSDLLPSAKSLKTLSASLVSSQGISTVRTDTLRYSLGLRASDSH